jgi:NAD(P)-dependent dehydrogenase (short-subunit alcohol dehydrogenase family)
MEDFAGLTAIVTGGASGIGASTAAMLQARGARVVVIDREAPRAPIDAVTYVLCDIRDRADVDRCVADIAGGMGGIDIVVNNAGVGASGDVSENDDEEWQRVLDINVVGPARVSAAALPFLRTSAHAAIVNVSSVIAVVGVRQRALYSASKGAVLALTLAMAADHVSEGIRVNAVLPGTAQTPWIARLLDSAPDPAAAEQALRSRQPMGRLVTADEVAFAVCYLASPLAGSTTGAALGVDGGMGTLRIPPPA